MQKTDLLKIETLLKAFAIESSQIKIEESDELIKIDIEIDEAEAGRLIGRFAQTLDSLQLLISLMLIHSDPHKHVLLDVAGYRARRLITLQSMVENAKTQANNSGLPTALPPLSSTERRQVHLMLKEDADFTSYSDGFGQDRRLYVAPSSL